MLLCVQVLHLKIHLENKRVYTSSSMSNSLRIYMDKEKHQNFISWPFCKMSVGLCNLQNAIYKNTIMRTYKIGLQALKLPCILDKLSIYGSSKYHMISKLCQGYFNAIISKIPNERDKMASLTCQCNMTRKKHLVLHLTLLLAIARTYMIVHWSHFLHEDQYRDLVHCHPMPLWDVSYTTPYWVAYS